MENYLKGKKLSFPFFLLGVFIFLSILFFAALVRSTGIISNNVLFLFDNGRDLLFVKKIVIEHKLLLIGPSSGGLQGYFHGVFWYYLLTIPFILGKGNPAAFTIFMAFMSTASAVAVFFILKKLSGFFPALIGFLIFSLATFSVSTAKFIWNPYPIVWLAPLYFLAMYLFTRKKRFALVLLSLLTALIIHFEVASGITLLTTLFVATIIFLFRKDSLKNKGLELVLVAFAFILPLLPSLLFDVRHHFLISSSVLKIFQSGGENITHNGHDSVNSISQRLSLRWQDLQTYSIASISNNALINTVLFILGIISVIFIIKKKATQDLQLLALSLITLLTPFFYFLTLKYSVWSYYWIVNPPLYTIVLLYFITVTFAQWKKGFIAGSIVILIALFVSFSPWTHFSSWRNGEIGQGMQNLATEQDVVKTIENDSGSQDFAVYVQTPPVYDYVYRYLFWWQGYRNTKKFPQQQKQRLTYVIVEGTDTDQNGVYFKEHTLHIFDMPTQTFSFPKGPKVEKFINLSGENPIDQNYFPSL